MKKIKKIVIIFLILSIISLFAFYTKSYAGTLTDQAISYIKDNNIRITSNNIVGKTLSLLAIMTQIACTGIAIIFLTWRGVKYIIAASVTKDARGMAAARTELINAVIASVLLFAASGIASIVYAAAS